MKFAYSKCFLLFLFLLNSCFLWGQIDVERTTKIGLNALSYKDYVVAIEYFNQIIEVRPEKADAYYFRAFAKFLLGDYVGAEKDATLAIERNPFISRCYMLRGVSRQSLGKNGEAVGDYRYALSIQPDDETLSFNLAGALFADKRFEEADSAVHKLLQRHPEHFRGQVLHAEIALSVGDTIRAEQAMKKLLDEDSLAVEPARILGVIALQRGNYQKAVSWFDRCFLGGSEELSDYINRGLARYHNQDIRGALADYDQAVRVSPKDPVALYNRALLKHEVSDLIGALEDFKGVLLVQPDNLSVRYNIALLQHELGNYTEAIKGYDYLLRRYPTFLSGYYQRADAKSQMGDVRGAERDYWTAYDIEKGKIRKGSLTQSSAQDSVDSQEELKALSRYNELLENVNPSSVAVLSNLKGNIQDEDILLKPFGPYIVSFLRYQDSELLPRNHYSPEIDSYNQRNKNYNRLFFVTEHTSIDSADVRSVLEEMNILLSLDNEEGHASFITPSDRAFRLGVDRILLRDYEQAVADFSESLNLCDAFAPVYHMRSYARIMQHRATSLNDEEDRGASHSSLSLPQRKSLPSQFLQWAMDDLNKVLELSPRNGYAFFNRALVYDMMGHKEKALTDYSSAIEVLPNPAEAFFNRGLLYLSLGKDEEAILDLSQAGEKGVYQAYSIIKRIQKKR